MRNAKQGDKVKVHVMCKLENGTTYGSTSSDSPLEFIIGDGKIIRGVEEAVIGMKPGESKTENVSSSKAYGPHREDLLITISKKQFPLQIDPKMGMELNMTRGGKFKERVKIVNISDETVILDTNHPLAGKNLIFDIKLLEVGSP